MCGRFFRHDVSWEEYHDALNLYAPENVEPPISTYNAAPTTLQPVIIPRKAGGTEMLPCVWGLIPSWWKKPLSEKKFSSFNAKSPLPCADLWLLRMDRAEGRKATLRDRSAQPALVLLRGPLGYRDD